MRVAADLGGRDQTDLYMGAYYAEAGAWRIEALFGLGRYDEARAVGKDAVAVAEKVLERRPGYRLALHAQQIMESEFGLLASADLNPLEATRASQRAAEVSATILRLDPDNTTSINNLAVAELDIGNDLWAAARLREGMVSLRRSADDFGRASAGGAIMSMSHFSMRTRAAVFQTFAGDFSGATATVAAGGPFLTKLRHSEHPGGLLLAIGESAQILPAAVAAAERDELPAAQRLAADAASRIQAVTIRGDGDRNYRAIWVGITANLAGHIEYRLGNFAAAEKAERAALEA